MTCAELYKKCTKENKVCSLCRFEYANPMQKDVPIDEAPPQCMNQRNKVDGRYKTVMPWDTCEFWEYYQDEAGNSLSWNDTFNHMHYSQIDREIC